MLVLEFKNVFFTDASASVRFMLAAALMFLNYPLTLSLKLYIIKGARQASLWCYLTGYRSFRTVPLAF